jgi:hypothetical protein
MEPQHLYIGILENYRLKKNHTELMGHEGDDVDNIITIYAWRFQIEHCSTF